MGIEVGDGEVRYMEQMDRDQTVVYKPSDWRITHTHTHIHTHTHTHTR